MQNIARASVWWYSHKSKARRRRVHCFSPVDGHICDPYDCFLQVGAFGDYTAESGGGDDGASEAAAGDAQADEVQLHTRLLSGLPVEDADPHKTPLSALHQCMGRTGIALASQLLL